MGRLMAGAVVALALAGCGGDDGGRTARGDPFGYLPVDAGAVAVIDTDLDGRPVRELEDALHEHPLAGRSLEDVLRGLAGNPPDIGFQEAKALLGGRLVVGTPGAGPLAAGSRDARDNAFVGALALDGETKARDFIEGRLGYARAGTVGGADVYEADGRPPLALEDGVLVLADRRETLESALRGHDGPAGRTFSRQQLDRGTAGLAPDAPVKLYVNAARLTAQPALRGVRKVRWADALRSAAATLHGDDGAVVLDTQALTDPAGLTSADLPFPPGDREVAIPEEPDAVNSGSADQSRTTTFLLSLLRAWRPAGRFAQDVARVERERGIDFEREVLRQFSGPSVSSLGAGGAFAARSTVRDPRRMERTLRKIAPDVPRLAQDLDPLRARGLSLLLLLAPDAPVGTSVLGDSDVEVQRVAGERSLYLIANLDQDLGGQAAVGPREIVFGLLGDAFVVASDIPRARAAATQRAAPRPGLRGASVVHARVNGGPLRDLGRAALGFDPGARAELSGTVRASRERVRATVRLRMP